MSLELSKKALAVKPSSTLAITDKSKRMKAAGIDVVGFGAGEPDFGTPENICEAAVTAIHEGFTRYTAASGIPELKQAISRKFAAFNHVQYAPDQIVISNGGKHSLSNVFTALLNHGDEVIIPAPYWLSYPEMVKLAEGIPVFIRGEHAQGYKVSGKQIQDAITPRTKALVLNTPSNPTGMVYTREELEEIAEVTVKNDIYVISDEMYEYLLYGGEEHVSIASLNEEIYKRTITCSGLSKSYAMTGWRIGYTGSSKEIASVMSSVQSHCTSNPNSIAQKAALEALTGPQDARKGMVQEFDKRRQYMYGRFQKMPYVSVAEPKGAFYCFVDLKDVLDMTYKGEKIATALRFADCLLDDYQVALVPCADFGFPDHVRLSYATSMEQIEKGLDRIETFLNNL